MLLALIALAGSSQATAAPMPITELVSSVRVLAPGKPFTVALHMKLPAGWHNYYANPGESGLPTTIAWTLPAGYAAGPIQWPVPKRIVTGGIPNFVYEGDLWLLTVISPTGPTQTKGTFALKARADWLLCSEACYPQSAGFELKLPIAVKSVPSGDARLAQAEGRLPHRNLTFSVSAVGAEKAVVLAIQDQSGAAAKATFYPADPEAFNADPPMVSVVPHGVQFKVPMNRYAEHLPKRLTGILIFPVPPHAQSIVPFNTAYWVDTPITS